MPIYEYICLNCRKRVNVFFRTFSAAEGGNATCPICAGTNLHRLVSRVAVMKSEERRMEDLADPTLMAGLEGEDPRALANFMRRMSDETGEPMDGEMSEVLNRLEAGESPEAVEQSMPDLGGDSVGDGDSFGDLGM